MKSIIIYETLHGSTEKCAKLLYKLIKTDIQIARLKDSGEIPLDEFEIVIIGGSIHNGVIQLRVENFIQKNHEKLIGKKLGLYLCCMEEGETARMQFEKAYPSELRDKAIAQGIFGGELNLGKMNFFEKRLTRKLTGITRSVSKINENEIRFFAEKMNKDIFN